MRSPTVCFMIASDCRAWGSLVNNILVFTHVEKATVPLRLAIETMPQLSNQLFSFHNLRDLLGREQ